MGWRFRKSVKIAPGTRLNFSKSGVSITNRVGKTGLYHRTQLAGGKKKTQRNTTNSRSSGSHWYILRLLLAAFLIIGALGNLKTSPVAAPISIGLGVLVLLWPLLFRKKKSENQEETVSDNYDLPVTREEKLPAEWTFVLSNNTDPVEQEALKELKIKIDAVGVKDTLSLSENAGVYVVSLGDLYLGQLQPPDAAWADEHFDQVEKLSSMHIYGGDRDVDDNSRPLTVKVWAELKPKTTAPHFTDLQLNKPMYDLYTVKGDQVVFVSSTKKIHIPGNCGVNLDRCTPMLYQDAADAGYEECANCFR